MTSSTPLSRAAGAGLVLALFSLGSACDEEPAPASSYFDERIAPILEFGCVQQTTGCHLASDRGGAIGNLDLSSYDALMRRDDVLPPYGPYPVGLLLAQGRRPDVDVRVETFDRAGRDAARRALRHRHDRHPPQRRWRTSRSARPATRSSSSGSTAASSAPACRRTLSENQRELRRSGVGSAPGSSRCVSPPTRTPRLGVHVGRAARAARDRAPARGCHGSRDRRLLSSRAATTERSCAGTTSSRSRTSASRCRPPRLLRRPLSSRRAAASFTRAATSSRGVEDGATRRCARWARDLVARVPAAIWCVTATVEEGLRFFANRVQPVLVRKGCMFLNCHSAAMFHDLRLRGGCAGHLLAHRDRSETTRCARLLLAIESPDPERQPHHREEPLTRRRASLGASGIAHRGGSLFEDFGVIGRRANAADRDDCAGVDADTGDLDTIPAYCVLAALAPDRAGRGDRERRAPARTPIDEASSGSRVRRASGDIRWTSTRTAAAPRSDVRDRDDRRGRAR